MNNVRCLNDLFHFSARDEYKIKYEQMERDVLLLNERVWQLKNVASNFCTKISFEGVFAHCC